MLVRRVAGMLFASSFALGMLSAGCATVGTAPTPRPAGQSAAGSVTVQVAEVQLGGVANSLSYSANIQARKQVSLVPKVAGRVTKLPVDVGSVVKAGDVVMEIEREALEAQVAQAEAGLMAAQARSSALEAGPRSENVAQAEANLDIARQRLAQLEAGGRAEQVAQAEASLAGARARLEQVKKGATAQELDQARMSIDQAKNALWGAQVSRDGICGNGWLPKFQCAAANSTVATAETAVKQAQSRLEQAEAGATPEAVAQAESAVRAAEETVKLARHPAGEGDLKQAQGAVRIAEAQLALTRKPTTEFDAQAARAAVAQAKAAADLARLQLSEASIRAPFAGVVSQRLVSEGAMVGPTAPVLTLISGDADVVINVDERTLALVKAGQPATVTASAYPGEEFAAVVASVAPSMDARSRTAQVRLAPQDSAGKLRDGMFAQVRLPLAAARTDALLVPKGAVAQEGQDTIVYAVADGRARRLVVRTGLSDADRVEVVEGLAEGQKVVVSGLSGLRDGAEVKVQ